MSSSVSVKANYSKLTSTIIQLSSIKTTLNTNLNICNAATLAKIDTINSTLKDYDYLKYDEELGRNVYSENWQEGYTKYLSYDFTKQASDYNTAISGLKNQIKNISDAITRINKVLKALRNIRAAIAAFEAYDLTTTLGDAEFRFLDSEMGSLNEYILGILNGSVPVANGMLSGSMQNYLFEGITEDELQKMLLDNKKELSIDVDKDGILDVLEQLEDIKRKAPVYSKSYEAKFCYVYLTDENNYNEVTKNMSPEDKEVLDGFLNTWDDNVIEITEPSLEITKEGNPRGIASDVLIAWGGAAGSVFVSGSFSNFAVTPENVIEMITKDDENEKEPKRNFKGGRIPDSKDGFINFEAALEEDGMHNRVDNKLDEREREEMFFEFGENVNSLSGISSALAGAANDTSKKINELLQNENFELGADDRPHKTLKVGETNDFTERDFSSGDEGSSGSGSSSINDSSSSDNSSSSNNSLSERPHGNKGKGQTHAIPNRNNASTSGGKEVVQTPVVQTQSSSAASNVTTPTVQESPPVSSSESNTTTNTTPTQNSTVSSEVVSKPTENTSPPRDVVSNRKPANPSVDLPALKDTTHDIQAPSSEASSSTSETLVEGNKTTVGAIAGAAGIGATSSVINSGSSAGNVAPTPGVSSSASVASGDVAAPVTPTQPQTNNIANNSAMTNQTSAALDDAVADSSSRPNTTSPTNTASTSSSNASNNNTTNNSNTTNSSTSNNKISSGNGKASSSDNTSSRTPQNAINKTDDDSTSSKGSGSNKNTKPETTETKKSDVDVDGNQTESGTLGTASTAIRDLENQYKKEVRIATGVTVSSMLMALAIKSLNFINFLAFFLVLLLIGLVYSTYRVKRKKRFNKEMKELKEKLKLIEIRKVEKENKKEEKLEDVINVENVASEEEPTEEIEETEDDEYIIEEMPEFSSIDVRENVENSEDTENIEVEDTVEEENTK